MADIVTIQEIKSHAKGHFFDEGATRFFNSRYPQTGHRVGDKAYFITSEQFIGSNGHRNERLYTLRELDYKTGDIHTVGDFNQLSKYEAQKQLNKLTLPLTRP